MTIELLGTNHVSPASARTVKRKIASGEYDIIAIELDRRRMARLLHEGGDKPTFVQLARSVGMSGAVFVIIGQWVQKTLGGRIGVEPGAEMLTAIKGAQEHQLKLALIDRPIATTLKRFSKAFNWKEKLRLFRSMFRFTKVNIDLKKAPSEKEVKKLIELLDSAVPALSKVLIHERNVYMSKKLLAVKKQFPEATILAVVGAGHVPGMKEYFAKVAPDALI